MANGKKLPSDLISFNKISRTFTVESEVQTLAGKYEITVAAISDDRRLSGQIIRVNFTLEAELNLSNKPPTFDDLNSTTVTYTFIKEPDSKS